MQDFVLESVSFAKKNIGPFIDVPWQIYPENYPHWVPPLRITVKELLSPKHPFHKQAETKMWVAKRGGRAIGRIMAIIEDESRKKSIGHFGLFECIDDLDVAMALWQKAENFLKGEGMTSVQGPFNPSVNYECGLLVDGFDDDPQIMMTYNPPYYLDFFNKFSLEKTMDLLAYRLPTHAKMPEFLTRYAKKIEDSERITWRHFNMSNVDEEVKIFLDIYNSAWEENWGHMPMSEEEIRYMFKELKLIVDTRLTLVAYVSGKPAGFLVALPDFNQVLKKVPDGKLLPWGIFRILLNRRKINRLRVVTLGIKKEYRKLGLAALFYNKIAEKVKEAGIYKEGEMSWILENNLPMNRPLQRMKADLYKRYRLFEKGL